MYSTFLPYTNASASLRYVLEKIIYMCWWKPYFPLQALLPCRRNSCSTKTENAGTATFFRRVSTKSFVFSAIGYSTYVCNAARTGRDIAWAEETCTKKRWFCLSAPQLVVPSLDRKVRPVIRCLQLETCRNISNSPPFLMRGTAPNIPVFTYKATIHFTILSLLSMFFMYVVNNKFVEVFPFISLPLSGLLMNSTGTWRLRMQITPRGLFFGAFRKSSLRLQRLHLLTGRYIEPVCAYKASWILDNALQRSVKFFRVVDLFKVFWYTGLPYTTALLVHLWFVRLCLKYCSVPSNV